jgi:hypothetical protein
MPLFESFSNAPKPPAMPSLPPARTTEIQLVDAYLTLALSISNLLLRHPTVKITDPLSLH